MSKKKNSKKQQKAFRIPKKVFDLDIVNISEEKIDNNRINTYGTHFAKSLKYREFEVIYSALEYISSKVDFRGIKLPFNEFTVTTTVKVDREFTTDVYYIYKEDNILNIRAYYKTVFTGKTIEKELLRYRIDLDTNTFEITSTGKLSELDSKKLKLFEIAYSASVFNVLDTISKELSKSSKVKRRMKFNQDQVKRISIKGFEKKKADNIIDLESLSHLNQMDSNISTRDYNYSIDSFSRRGYWRTYKATGKRIWIEPTIVNIGSKGEVIKHRYKVD